MTNLFELMQQNPELPVVPMVDGDICEDYGCYWLGSFGEAEVREVVSYHERFYDDRDSFKEAFYDYHSEELTASFNYDPGICIANPGKYTAEEIAANEEANKRLEEYLESVADQYMIKAIVVYIGLPDTTLFKEID